MTARAGMRGVVRDGPFHFSFATNEEESMALRISLLKGDETIRGTPLEALVHVVRGLLGNDGVDEICAKAGVKAHSFNMFQKYPLGEFLALEREAARVMAPLVGGFDQAVYRIGGGAVDVFFDSVAGRTMKILAGKEPHRMLGAVPNGYGVLVNFGKREYVKSGERSGVFHFTRELLGPVHTCGIFDTALSMVYGVDTKFHIEAQSPVDFRFKLTW